MSPAPGDGSRALRVLGLDPGSRACGFGLIEFSGGGSLPLEYGVWRPPAGKLSGRLRYLFQRAGEFLARHRPDAVSIETVFAGKSISSAVALCQARGVLLLASAVAEVPVFEYEPLTVKKTVVGYGRAEKPQLRAMVLSLLPQVSGRLPLDAADALAVALCHCHHALSPYFDRGSSAC